MQYSSLQALSSMHLFSIIIYKFIAKRETQVKKLKEDKARLEGEVEELEKKIERMSAMAKQASLPSAI